MIFSTETIMMAFAFGIGAVGLAILFAVKRHFDRKIDEENRRKPTI